LKFIEQTVKNSSISADKTSCKFFTWPNFRTYWFFRSEKPFIKSKLLVSNGLGRQKCSKIVSYLNYLEACSSKYKLEN